MHCSKTLSLVLVGVFASIGLAMILSACAVTDNWYSMFILIPGVLAVVAAYGLYTSISDDYKAGCVSAEGWVFTMTFLIASCAGIPTVLYRVGKIGKFELGLAVGGVGVITVGYIINKFISTEDEYDMIM